DAQPRHPWAGHARAPGRAAAGEPQYEAFARARRARVFAGPLSVDRRSPSGLACEPVVAGPLTPDRRLLARVVRADRNRPDLGARLARVALDDADHCPSGCAAGPSRAVPLARSP